MSDLVAHPNPTLATIHARHSVRLFTEEPVGDRDLEAILDAANQAPSAHNQQSWRFIVVRGRRKQELAQLVTARAGQFPKPSSSLLRMAARSIAGAPVVVAVANTGELIEHGTRLFKVDQATARDFFRTMEIQSSAAAAENLLLAATSLGLATVWLGVLYLIKDQVLEFLDQPKGEFMAVIPVGHAVKSGKGPNKRPLSELVMHLEEPRG